MLERFGSSLRYLRGAARPWKWRIARGMCPACGAGQFIALANDPYYNRCLGCRANVVNLSLIPVAIRHFKGLFAQVRAYELSSYGATFDFLSTRVGQLSFSEYFPGLPFGNVYEGIRNEDVQALTFADESFDIVTSSQVFEHVPDDLRGYRECYRVLKQGGALVFTVPLYNGPQTEQVARLTVNGTVEWLGAPEFHDSRLGGPNSAPVFWRHSATDLVDRVKTAGFRHAVLEDVLISEQQGRPERVLYAVK